MYEEYKDLKGFDPSKMNDPRYVRAVKEARQIKDNEKEVLKSQSELELAIKQEQTREEIKKDVTKQVLRHIEDTKKEIDHDVDFTMQEFIDQEKFNDNSSISKQIREQSQALGKPVSIDSIWMSKTDLKKYLTAKNIFKIKERDSNKYRVYRYHSIGEEEIEKLRAIADDMSLFYHLVQQEGHFTEDYEGARKPALLRDGKYYTSRAKLETVYRKQIAEMCFGIDDSSFQLLEQWSDPEFTVKDIWGLNDIIDAILERAIIGSSYFRIASKK